MSPTLGASVTSNILAVGGLERLGVGGAGAVYMVAVAAKSSKVLVNHFWSVL